MGILDGIMKRVERRALREAENLATKKIKGILFGTKEEVVEVSCMVEYRRIEMGMEDVLSLYLFRNQYETFDWMRFINGRKKIYQERMKRMRRLAQEMRESDRPEFYEIKMRQLEEIC